MSLFRWISLAACILLLGFSLARDGAVKMRLEMQIEAQKELMGRLRQDLAISRSDNHSLTFDLAWGEDLTEIEQVESVAQLGIDDLESVPAEFHHHSVREFISVERGGERN